MRLQRCLPPIFANNITPLCVYTQDTFVVKSIDGTVFEDVDLSDDWADADEKGNCLSILDFEWKLEVTKA